MSEPEQTGNGNPETLSAQRSEPVPGDPDFKVTLNKNAAKRANASVIGMILALLVSMACILPVILLNAQPQAPGYRPDVNVAAVAGNAAAPAGFPPLVIDTPSGWNAQYARYAQGTQDGVPTWEVGYLAPNEAFVGITQSVKANQTWINQVANGAPVTGKRTVDGHDWELRDKGTGPKTLVLAYRGTTVILNGRGSLEDFDTIAQAVTEKLDASPVFTPKADAATAK